MRQRAQLFEKFEQFNPKAIVKSNVKELFIIWMRLSVLGIELIVKELPESVSGQPAC